MKKHTPGPWRPYHENGSLGSGGHWGIESATLGTVAVCAAKGAEERHNALLLAAAPDLLEALTAAKQVLITSKQYFPKSIRDANMFHLLNVLANVIEPAIAKTEKTKQ